MSSLIKKRWRILLAILIAALLLLVAAGLLLRGYLDPFSGRTEEAPAGVPQPNCAKAAKPSFPKTIKVKKGYSASYFIAPNGITTPADITVNSKGELFVGEVRGNAISKVSPGGKVKEWAEMGVYAIDTDGEDNLYGYSFPSGSVYKADKDGRVSVLVGENDLIQSFAESPLAVSPKGEIYLARNSEKTFRGTLYRISLDGKIETIKADTGALVSALAFNQKGELFATMGAKILRVDLLSGKMKRVAKVKTLGFKGWGGLSFHGLAVGGDGVFYVTSPTAAYRVDPTTGETEILAAGFYQLQGIALDKQGGAYAVDRFTNGVYRIAEGKVECLVSPTYICTPQAMAFNSKGELFIAEDEAGLVGQYSTTGEYVGSYGATVFQPPLAGIAIDSEDNIFVSESAPGFPDQLVKFVGGEDDKKIVSKKLGSPSGLAFSGDTLYVAEFAGNKISSVDKKGKIAAYLEGVEHPLAIDFDGQGNLYVVVGSTSGDDGGRHIIKFNKSEGPSYFFEMDGLADVKVSPKGEVLIATMHGTVYLVTPSGKSSELVTGLGSAMGIAFDKEGNIYISDDNANAVIKIEKD